MWLKTWLFLLTDGSFPLCGVFSGVTTQDKLLQFAVGSTAWMRQAFPLAQEKQVGLHCLDSQPARAGDPWGWGPLHHSLGLQMGGGSKARPRSRHFALDRQSHMGPHCPPTTHGMRVVKMERTAGRKGGLRGQISAHGAKERCFSWEGKGGKTAQTFLSLQGCQSPALSFFRGKYCTFGKGFE